MAIFKIGKNSRMIQGIPIGKLTDVDNRLSKVEQTDKPQTPWTSDIDGGGYRLQNINGIHNDSSQGQIYIETGNNGAGVEIGAGNVTTGGTVQIDSGGSDTGGDVDINAASGATNGGSVNIQAGSGGSSNGRINFYSDAYFQQGVYDSTQSLGSNGQALISTGSQVVWGATPVADGTYTVGAPLTPVTGNAGTITTVNGIITAIQEAT